MILKVSSIWGLMDLFIEEILELERISYGNILIYRVIYPNYWNDLIINMDNVLSNSSYSSKINADVSAIITNARTHSPNPLPQPSTCSEPVKCCSRWCWIEVTTLSIEILLFLTLTLLIFYWYFISARALPPIAFIADNSIS